MIAQMKRKYLKDITQKIAEAVDVDVAKVRAFISEGAATLDDARERVQNLLCVLIESKDLSEAQALDMIGGEE